MNESESNISSTQEACSVHGSGSPRVEWEIVLSGGHPDICVIVSAPENATDEELQSLAELEAMAKTYIWSKKRVRQNDLDAANGPR